MSSDSAASARVSAARDIGERLTSELIDFTLMLLLHRGVSRFELGGETRDIILLLALGVRESLAELGLQTRELALELFHLRRLGGADIYEFALYLSLFVGDDAELLFEFSNARLGRVSGRLQRGDFLGINRGLLGVEQLFLQVANLATAASLELSSAVNSFSSSLTRAFAAVMSFCAL